MTDLQRQRRNEWRLKSVHPAMASKARAVLSDLEGHGYRPQISSGYRTLAEQQEAYRKGNSKVKFSFHNATMIVGSRRVPAALAVDITDARWGWDAPKGEALTDFRRFWVTLGRTAYVHELVWGGFWGLTRPMREALQVALTNRNFDYTGPLGWDVAHVQLLPNSTLPWIEKGHFPPVT